MPGFYDLFTVEISDSMLPYMALPNVNNPRLIVCNKNYGIFKKGLLFHNTASVKNKVFKHLLIYSYLLSKYIYKKNRIAYTDLVQKIIYILGKEVIGQKVFIASFFIGTSGNNNRKVSAQILDQNKKFIGIVKIPIVGESTVYLKNEHETLFKLLKKKFVNLIVPTSEFFVFEKNIPFLYESNIFDHSSSIPLTLNNLIVNANLELAKHTLQNNTNEYLNELFKSLKLSDITNKLLSIFRQARQKILTEKLPTVLIHGDFVMYNMRKKSNKLALIDWEFARRGLPLFDLFHFMFQGLIQVKKKDLKATVRIMFNERNMEIFSKYLFNFNTEAHLIKDIFTLYLFDNLMFEKKLKPDMDLKKSNYYNTLLFF